MMTHLLLVIDEVNTVDHVNAEVTRTYQKV
jgi:hypothetical protein